LFSLSFRRLVELLEAASLFITDVSVEEALVFKFRNLLQLVVLLKQGEAANDRICTKQTLQ
jgi:hypothetical protein